MNPQVRHYLTKLAQMGAAAALALFASSGWSMAAETPSRGIIDSGIPRSVELAALPAPGSETELIRNSAHDLSLNGEEPCTYCHTPSMDGVFKEMKWNRQPVTASYIMYSSLSIDMAVSSQPQGVSLVCLSCHDGIVAYDEMNRQDKGGLNGRRVTGRANLGTDLSNDHPVSITYSTARDPYFNIAVNGHVGPLPLYGAHKDKVECGTCHDPHDGSSNRFLRVDNARSSLCMTCHIK